MPGEEDNGAAVAAAQGTPAPEPALSPAPAVDPAPAAASSAGDAPAPASSPEPVAGAPAADAAPAAKPANEFAPSLLDEAAKAKEPQPAPEGDKPKEPAKDAAKSEGDKPADAAKDSPGETPPEPIKYEFTYPEGVKPEDVNSERMTAYTDLIGGARLAPEVGQKLLDMHFAEINEAVQKAVDRNSQHQWDVFNEQQKRWREDLLSDQELGGSRHQTAMNTVMSLIDAFNSRDPNRDMKDVAAERQRMLDTARTTGFANNADWIRLLHWAGSRLAKEGTPRPAPPPRQQQPTGRDRGLARYGRTGAPNGAA